ncbi:hypothetical protein SAY86_006862 [Trapa natans]|uniref:Peroxisomal membrane protein PEX14 n=1 Tax=Trapa natans TaxID=22666 RepID=A0AAN7L7F2_TRANT|nr:hypothetical protein SAY86_006862 [Trapa natans]
MAGASTDVKAENPVDAEAPNEANQTAPMGMDKPISPSSVFVNSEPIRPEQVENAVKFLSHPKVRGSPVMYRRSFLEKKGLTKEEIDEAFRRVPDPSPTVQAAQDAPAKTVSNAQAQAIGQVPQATTPAPAGVASTHVSGPRFHWTHALYAIGIVAVSGAGTAVLFKSVVAPRLKSWVRKITSEDEHDVAIKTGSKPSIAEETAAAAKSAADAAAQVAKASQELMTMSTGERRNLRDLMDMLDAQLHEIRAMNFSIRKLEDQANISSAVPSYIQDSRVSSSKPYVNGKAEFDTLSGRSTSPPALAKPSVPPHPKSYMEIMAMVQRGERPPNVKVSCFFTDFLYPYQLCAGMVQRGERPPNIFDIIVPIHQSEILCRKLTILPQIHTSRYQIPV